ncbi:2-polyprenyl-3-methyl-6-methoxy-1,4-benzoquinone monooxygenase [Pollutimonas thiosulfatoxidans]|uniref:3-demethoxyubiquinol 3-hydroxylase n=1 Tax=Pollutimonas thiosulfatoxidans TaxID=2028345 RepID=A0A410G876_9BURK|nr:2-polyprenyl-3-methyl-6-methoxy-1,4-benzoquinone monooxygenase [Pollutimonas thiosulfatoxidans]MBF6616688.1 2-polyprenyl-3-methyl-6-methoxy-1,4-benzoquinone monooxygenase [Candidimonas sp.]QAA92490.1 demethoxyubiquinone hydroxylase family protein [Pollutimonas thiosulfatoxidans]
MQEAIKPSVQFSRQMSVVDNILAEVGRAVSVLDGSVHAGRPNPAGKLPFKTEAEPQLTPTEQRHAAGLMRVNHVGEICAQALYRGQAVFCGDAAIRDVLHGAAAEEVDHLVWCQERLNELESRPSLLNPLWYAGSFTLGLLASKAGRGKNLGFMAETERQVEQHLDQHLQDLPATDVRSRDIVEQMRQDEIVHRRTAEKQGAHRLPKPVRLLMRGMSKVMTTTAYRF